MVLLCHGGASCSLITLEKCFWDPQSSKECETLLSNSTWPQKHPHAHSDVIHDHRSRKRPFIDHVNTAPTPQHLQTCLRTGKETEAQSQEERCPGSHSKFMVLSGLEQSSVNSTPASYHFPWVTPGFLRKDILGILPQLFDPKFPGHKFWHRPKTMFTPLTVILITPNVYSIGLDFLYSPCISKCIFLGSLVHKLSIFLLLTLSCFISHLCQMGNMILRSPG